MSASKRGLPFTRGGLVRSYEAHQRQQDERGRWWIAPRIAAHRAGYHADLLNIWSSSKKGGCPVLGNQILRRRPFRDGLGQTTGFYLEEQIEALIDAKHEPADNPVPGYVSIDEAARMLGVNWMTVLGWIRNGVPLDDHRPLPERRRRAKRKNGRYYWRRYVPLDALQRVKAMLRPPQMDGFVPAHEAAELLGVCRVTLLNLRRQGKLNAIKRTVVRKNLPRVAWHYPLADLLALTKCRKGGAAAENPQPAEVSDRQSPVSGDTPPTAMTEAPRTAGRPRSEATEAVYKFCYEGRVKGRKRMMVRQDAVRLFGARAPKVDADVTLYAKRYAKRHGLPVP